MSMAIAPGKAKDAKHKESVGEHDGMTYSHTLRMVMTRSKIAITIDESTLEQLDQLVEQAMFSSRSRAIQEAVEEKLVRLSKGRLARECSRLDPDFEKALAEEGLSEELAEGPEY
jgi:Arc/MetJ-type ribon-helix-helix transcriptional regulator